MADETQLDQLILQADAYLDKGDLAQARRIYAEICRAHDDNAHLWLMFGAINGELGNVEVARNALERAIALDSENAEANLVLAHLLRANRQPVKAMASASRAVEVDAKFLEGWLFVSGIAGRLGNWAWAEEASNKVIALAPERTEGHVNLGNVLLATGRVPQAEESFRKALTLGETAEARFGLGTALSALNRHAEAEPALATALQLDENNAVFREALAACLERLGRTGESMGVRAGPV